MKRKRKPGRPKSENPLSESVRLRCLPAEKATWFAAAGGERAFSEWARRVLNGAAGR